MNKKLMAVAVARSGALGAVGAPSVALAQSSTVTISGNLNYIYGQYNNGGNGHGITGATSTNSKLSYDAMNNSESELVIAGNEALGGGMSAWFMCSSTFDVLGQSASAGTGGFCGRNSAIGLKGNFGNAYVGNYDTPAKLIMNNYRVFALSYPMGLGTLFNTASSDVNNQTQGGPEPRRASSVTAFNQAGGGASFSRRQQRLLTYISPEWKGLTGMAALSAANEASGNSMGTGIQKPRLYSFGANYVNGPLQLGVGYEIHKDYNPGALTVTQALGSSVTCPTRGGTDTSWQLGAQYSFLNNALKLNAVYVKLNYQITGNLTTDQNNWSLNGSWNIAGPHTVRLGYVDMGTTGGNYGGNAANGFGSPANVGAITANGGAGNTGAKKYVFEYAYGFSKRTEMSFGYARQNNDSQSNQNVGTGSSSVNFGESQTYYGLRLTHKF